MPYQIRKKYSDFVMIILFVSYLSRVYTYLCNKKYNFSRPPLLRQRVGYQSNQKLMHHYKHSKNQLNS